ncbi:MAG: outer membrane beta-barrel protein [Rikenellaceae bacterium]|nr:outer membrane beta-barrel protein [Rikenellaceae bacterium]MCL2692376.1 outer membrane beta-barrel protein [Rikenellaceae bacterium]
MKKLFIIAALLVCAHATAFAQRTGTVSGQITDDATGESITGAVVEMRSVADTTFVRHIVSDRESKFSIAELPFGNYTLRVTFLGYEPNQTQINVNARNIALAHVFLKSSVTELDGVTVMAQAVRVSMRGDTISYNAAAFQVSDDADADELLRQLPGVEVGEDGSLRAQGKDVQQILVDGKETFGTDVAAVMRNIPANAIQRVEVYNKLSDFAQTTGINDGDDFQVMNFVTGVTFAQYGTFTGLYGYKDKYSADAQYNIMTGSHGLMLNTSSNNTGGGGRIGMGMMGGGGGGSMTVTPGMMGGGGGGGRTFTVTPGMMGGGGFGSRFGGGGGMSENNKILTHNVAFNHNYDGGDKLKTAVFYSYGHTDAQTKSESDRTYFNTSIFNDLYNRTTRVSESNSINNRHIFGGNVQWRPAARQMLNLRIGGTYANTNAHSTSTENQFTDVIENLFQYYRSRTGNHTEQYNFTGGLNYGVGFAKAGRSLSVGLNAGANKNDGNSTNDIHLRILGRTPQLDSMGRNRSLSDSYGWNVAGRVQYSEPLSEYWSLMATYEFSNRFSDRNTAAERWESFGNYNNFDNGHWVDWNEGSNILETRDVSHRTGGGIYYSKNNDLLRIDVVYKHTLQKMDRILPRPYKADANFHNMVYNAMYNKQLTPQHRLEFRLEADTQNPSITQLQDVDDISSTIYVSTGNPDLQPYYTHTGSVSYNMNNLTQALNFSLTAHGSMTSDYIGTDTRIITDDQWETPNGTIIEKGGQYSRPINMGESAWSFGLTASLGKPINFMKCNFNMSGGMSYSETPGIINGVFNTAQTQSYNVSASLNSNWSQRLIVSTSYRIAPGVTNNTREGFERSTGLNQSASLSVRWDIVERIFMRTNLRYTNNLTRQAGIAEDYRFENAMCNVSVGKRLFRNRRGELTFSVNDLFNQSRVSNQRIFPNYIENSVDRGIGRFYSVSFTYRLRDFFRGNESLSRGTGMRSQGMDGRSRESFMRDVRSRMGGDGSMIMFRER